VCCSFAAGSSIERRVPTTCSLDALALPNQNTALPLPFYSLRWIAILFEYLNNHLFVILKLIIKVIILSEVFEV